MIQIKRAYDEAHESDGVRILVDRLWPRGVKKEFAKIDWWAKNIAPSPALRKWYNHEPEKFAEFSARYDAELADEIHQATVKKVLSLAEKSEVTLVYGAKDTAHSHALVLQHFLEKQIFQRVAVTRFLAAVFLWLIFRPQTSYTQAVRSRLSGEIAE